MHCASDEDAFPEIETRPAWPKPFPLGRVSSSQVAADFAQHIHGLSRWREWATDNGVTLHEETRRISGTRQRLATHVVVPDIDTAAAILAENWPQQLAIARRRSVELIREFPTLAANASLTRILRAVVKLSDLDFDILCRVAHWFHQHPREASDGLTPRQVPLVGIQAKWLNNHQGLVRALAGLDDLRLNPGHPPRVHFTYLDPEYLATGRRRHDSYSVGDCIELPYSPLVVVISENKDTAIGFPPVPGGIAVEGAGTGGSTIAAVPWIRDAPFVMYWGDMDADGLCILNEFRERGIPAASMFMDTASYHRYNRYGSNHDPKGKLLEVPKAVKVDDLWGQELALYELLTSGNAPVLRIEQERIPLQFAEAELVRQLEESRSVVGSIPPQPTQWMVNSTS